MPGPFKTLALCFDSVNKEYSAFSILRIFHTPHFPYSAFSILRTFHTPHFPYSSFSIFLIFHIPHFPYCTFSILLIFHTPHFPYSSFSILRIFHTPHFPYSSFSIQPVQSDLLNFLSDSDVLKLTGSSFHCFAPLYLKHRFKIYVRSFGRLNLFVAFLI